MEQKRDICPYCGGTETILGQHMGHRADSHIRRADKLMDMDAQTLYHVICLNCGTVIRSYIGRPQDWRPKKK